MTHTISAEYIGFHLPAYQTTEAYKQKAKMYFLKLTWIQGVRASFGVVGKTADPAATNPELWREREGKEEGGKARSCLAVKKSTKGGGVTPVRTFPECFYLNRHTFLSVSGAGTN